jgi:hypothetical protein
MKEARGSPEFVSASSAVQARESLAGDPDAAR